MAAEQRREDVVRDAFQDQVGTAPPDETRDADRDALRILSDEWATRAKTIREAMTEGQSWTGLAQVTLNDFPPEMTLRTRVHVSGAGNAYHRFRDCPALATGKDMARDEGKSLHSVTGMSMEKAAQRMGFGGRPLRACKTCIPWPTA